MKVDQTKIEILSETAAESFSLDTLADLLAHGLRLFQSAKGNVIAFNDHRLTYSMVRGEQVGTLSEVLRGDARYVLNLANGQPLAAYRVEGSGERFASSECVRIFALGIRDAGYKV